MGRNEERCKSKSVHGLALSLLVALLAQSGLVVNHSMISGKLLQIVYQKCPKHFLDGVSVLNPLKCNGVRQLHLKEFSHPGLT